ncbi:hypothetical protein [Gloeothece verrucosa]|uniref:Uncharacterized protein n=1 Tax=Gloeothece verrucosa (strain PCC 7822) TaxID=497965 RepID=E0UMA0_GLOV7|nr:hypothetical protein [Gloeothece verrucosa]ADN18080.1 hypothetical protein Cyan7822_6280 [Gloeothece verrucosa PCC 7822]
MSYFSSIEIEEEKDLEANISPDSEENTLTPLEQEKILNELSDPISIVSSHPEELDLSSIEEDSSSTKNPWLRIVILTLISGLGVGFIILILMLFNGSKPLNQSASTSSQQEKVDPVAEAQQQAEQRQARLILLGEKVGGTVPVQDASGEPSTIVKAKSTAHSSQRPVSTTSPPPPRVSETPPPPTYRSVRTVSTPPPRVSETVFSPSSSYRPLTYNPPPSSVRQNVSPHNSKKPEDPTASRETLSKRGWSGFAENNQNQSNQILAQSPQPDESLGATLDDIPVIRLGEPDNGEITWQYYAHQKSPTALKSNSKLIAAGTEGSGELVPPKAALKDSNFNNFNTSPTVYPVGTQLVGQLEMPIVVFEGSNVPFTIKLTQNLTGNNGRIVLAKGTILTAQVTGVASNGLMSANVTSISYIKNGKPVTQPIPSNYLLVLSKSGQPLQAKVVDPRNGEIARQDLILGILGAADRGFEIINQPKTQTQIVQSGYGFSSSSSSSSRDNNVPAGLAQGFFGTLKDRWENRLQQSSSTNVNNKPVFVVRAKTEVRIFLNAVLEIN